MSNLADKARKAYFALKSKIPYSDNLSFKSWLKPYNSMIVPIIIYGSEVWISDFKSNFDTLDKIQFKKMQNMILKNILGVHGKSSNLTTRCEIGTLPIKIKCYNLMFRYYTRFCEIDGQPGGQYDILEAAYEVDKTLTNKENSWVNKINEISKLIGLSSFNISTFLFKQKLENYCKVLVKIETEISNIKNCGLGKLKFYSKIFTEFKQPGYLDYDIPKTLRNKLTKIRISAHSLAIETGRYTKPVT
jgi:hypothetical protein